MQKNSAEFTHIWLITFFLLLLLLYPLLYLFPGHDNNTENRTLFKFPKVTSENATSIPKYIDSYIDDHMPFKSATTRFYSRFMVEALHTSTANTVILGKSKFLFYDSKYDGGSDTVADYAVTDPYSEEKLSHYARQLEKLQKEFAKIGTKFYLMIAPNKESIYPEFMPDYVNRYSEKTRADVLVNYLRTHSVVPVIYPKDALLAAKANNMLYYRNDTHWNELGGLIAARSLLNATLDIPMPKESYILATEEAGVKNLEVFMDLANNLSLRTVLPELFYKPVEESRPFSMDGEIGDYYYGSHLISFGDQDSTSIMMVRDSFFSSVHAYMAGYFSRGDFFWTSPKELMQILEQASEQKPDIFVYEIVERNLDENMRAIMKKTIVIGFIAMLLAGLFYSMGRSYILDRSAEIEITADVQSPTDFTFQVYYIPTGEEGFSEKFSTKIEAKGAVNYQTVKLTVPVQSVRGLRLDVDTHSSEFVGIKNVLIGSLSQKKLVSDYIFDTALKNGYFNQCEPMILSDGSLVLQHLGEDAYIYAYFDFGASPSERQYLLWGWAGLCVLAAVCATLLLWRFRRILQEVVQTLQKEKRLLWHMAVQDFKKKYIGSYFGIVWVFIQPLITVLVFWFVFQIGFRSAPVSDVPFAFWLICGMIPWFYFSDAWNSATYSLQEYSYLVKKVMFQTTILPLIRILSALFVHIVFYFLLVFIALLYGFPISWHILQLVYYTACCTVLVAGLSYFSAAITIFFRDLGNMVSIILQIGMWITPILWSHTVLSEKMQLITKLNPMFYIVQGFRDAMFQRVWFFERPLDTAIFAIICTVLFLGGVSIFRRLKPHFSDVL